MKEVSKSRKYVNFTETITVDNVQKMGEMLAVSAFKPFLRYADNVFGSLYKGLILDIHWSNAKGHTFSDGYDFAQEAICFLCGHIGKKLADIIGTDRCGKEVSVKLACFRTITRSLNRQMTNKFRNVCIDKVYEPKIATQFDTDIESKSKENEVEDFTKVNDTIEKLFSCDS